MPCSGRWSQGGPLDRGQVLEQLVGRRGDVHGWRAVGPAQEDIGGVERHAQVPGLGLEDLPCKSSQRRCRSLGGGQDQLVVHAGYRDPGLRHFGGPPPTNRTERPGAGANGG